MKEIVFLLPQLKNGGGVRVFVELANILCESADVTILVPQNSEEGITFNLNNKVKLISIGRFKETKIQKIRNLFSVIKAANKKFLNQYIIITDPIMSILSFFIKGNNVYRFIQADDYRIFDDGLLLKNKWIIRFYKVLTLLSYHDSIKFMFNSKFSYDSFIKLRGRYSKTADIPPFHCVHPCINQEIFKPVSTIDQKKTLQLCLVARKHPAKGLDTFLESWDILKPEIKEQIEKVILISHDDLSSFNLKDFEIVNVKDDFEIASVFQTSDIFISTSWMEGFGLPPLEAMACGCAVITSASQGINEYARHQENCLIYPPRNAFSLADHIASLVNDPNLRSKLVLKGTEDATSFQWHKSATRFREILEDGNHV
ncbi:glycosyltransferase family 4 protein [Pedobacter hiemivivus]|uniref:Glycosyltransferase n=1 Tax=Pedobacter hiemivivus TaxID=2530454 RepID=A0A4R0NAE7_9SPHI|nr:glycosyltransferase family 4 protein [Pedobacter hiemivivus]TCC96233.1 glycosyltransferase [Pedobacter hiemivivus]